MTAYQRGLSQMSETDLRKEAAERIKDAKAASARHRTFGGFTNKAAYEEADKLASAVWVEMLHRTDKKTAGLWWQEAGGNAAKESHANA